LSGFILFFSILAQGPRVFAIPEAVTTQSTSAAKSTGAISFQGDIVHLEFSGRSNWDYKVQKQNSKEGGTDIEILVDPLEMDSLKKMKSFQSPIISRVEFEEKGIDGKNKLRLHSTKQIDFFDYLTDQPSRLVVDIYLADNSKNEIAQIDHSKSGFTKKEKTESAISEKAPEKIGKVVLPKKGEKGLSESKRSPAGDVMVVNPEGNPNSNLSNTNKASYQLGIFDGSDPDYDRFNIKDYDIKEESMIQSSGNIYLDFPKIEVPILSWEKINSAGVIYEITPKETNENKEARLLYTLFEKGRSAVFLKTLGWFREKYPQSEYLEILDFMAGEIYLKLWRKDGFEQEYEQTIAKFKEVIKKHPQSPLAERFSIMLGFLAIEKGDFPAAVRMFNSHVESSIGPTNGYSKTVAQLGKGLALSRQGMFGEALEIYQNLAKASKHLELKIEAQYRIADVFVAQARKTYKKEDKQKLYKKVVAQYEEAIKLYPGAEAKYPSSYYNRAEALFSLMDFKKSLDVHREFLKKYPFNEYAVFSLTRIGELLEILGADSNKVIGAFLEASFRFGDNPNIVITRLRLLSKKMRSMNKNEMDNTLKEISSLVEHSEIENIKQFSTMMIAEGFNRRGEPDRSIEYLTQYYRDNITTVDRKAFGKIIEKNYNDKIRAYVENGNSILALKTHKKYVKDWPFFTNRLDMRYYVGKAFEQAGAYDEARKYYLNVLNRVYALKGTLQEKELRVVENVPSDDHLNLRLAEVSFRNRQYKESYQYLRAISKPETLREEDQIERIELAVDLLDQKGDIDSAVRYLSELLRTWSGRPGVVAAPYLKLADLEIRRGNKNEALAALDKIEKLQVDSDSVAISIHVKALEKMAQIYSLKKEFNKAMGVLEKALELYEEKLPQEHNRYQLGELYFGAGKSQKANEIWSQLKDKNGFWYKLAQEKLKDASWSDGYKKYMKRIPAMADVKE